MDALAMVRGYETLPRNNQDVILDHLANIGPLSVAIDGSNWGSYSSGVFNGCSFTLNIEINHGT